MLTGKPSNRFYAHFMTTRHGLMCRYCRALLDPIDRLGRWNYFKVQAHISKHLQERARPVVETRER